MSHNLSLPGCPYELEQTTTDFTDRWAKRPTMEVFEAYVREYLDPLRPPPLRDKDSRNPFKVKEWRQQNAHVDRRVDKLRRWLEQNPVCAMGEHLTR